MSELTEVALTINELALTINESVPALLNQRTRLEFAVARHDKEGMREINKTLKHLYLDLRELYVQISDLVGAETDFNKFEYEDWFLPDHKDITEKELFEKLIEYHKRLRVFCNLVEGLTAYTRNIGIKTGFIDHLLGHITLTLLLFKLDLETITGESIQP